MNTNWTTTLSAIRAYEPCAGGWAKLLRHLGKTEADDEPLALETILESNGLDDAIWALRCVEGKDREIRLFAVACARRVEHMHPVCKPALDVAERYANGQASVEELDAAWSAEGAAWVASDAAGAAAWAAARDATWAVGGVARAAGAAWAAEAARVAAGTAAGDAAGAAAWAAARADAWDAEPAYQRELFLKLVRGGSHA